MWLQFKQKMSFRGNQENYRHDQISENWMDNRINEWMDEYDMPLEDQAWLLWMEIFPFGYTVLLWENQLLCGSC